MLDLKGVLSMVEEKDLLTASEAMKEYGYNNAYLVRLLKAGDLEG